MLGVGDLVLDCLEDHLLGERPPDQVLFSHAPFVAAPHFNTGTLWRNGRPAVEARSALPHASRAVSDDAPRMKASAVDRINHTEGAPTHGEGSQLGWS